MYTNMVVKDLTVWWRFHKPVAIQVEGDVDGAMQLFAKAAVRFKNRGYVCMFVFQSHKIDTIVLHAQSQMELLNN
jgi:hypothetical protein